MAKLTEGVYEKYGVSYKTLTLTDGDYALTVTPEKGGMATSFTKAGEEYLWLRDKNFESTDRPRCGVPILFPNCGKPDGGAHHFGGADHPIEVHGLADLLPWQVKSATEDAIELSLTPNGLTKFVYPFDFALTMRYTLAGSKAGLALTVKNTGDKPMPFSVGFHPYFGVTKLENVSFDITAATCSENAKGNQPAAPAQITLTNETGVSYTNGWTVEFTLDREITSMWSGECVSLGNNRYRVSNPGWDGNWAAGKTMTLNCGVGAGSDSPVITDIVMK